MPETAFSEALILNSLDKNSLEGVKYELRTGKREIRGNRN